MARPPRPSRRPPRALRVPRRAIIITVAAAIVLAAGALAIRAIRAPHRPPPAPVIEPVATTPLPRPTTIVEFTDGCMTARCHASIGSAAETHAPVTAGACDACHERDIGGHKYPARSDPSPICTTCHADPVDASHAHRALRTDGCVTCHDPHGSAQSSLIVAANTGALCIRCHPAEPGRISHPPYADGRCETCHDPHSGSTPSASPGSGGACAACHTTITDAMATTSSKHTDLRGACLACHAAHASDHGGITTTSVPELCLGCHTDVPNHEHSRACLACHDPHASTARSMLASSERTVCFSCHATAITTSDGRTINPPFDDTPPFIHAPVRSGECSACHDAHGSSAPHLLTAEYSDLPATPFDPNDFALCFSCHDPTLAVIGGSTGFRNGDRNLHAAHLRAPGKAYSCGTCHATHASDLPHLMARTVNFQGSTWAMPLGYTATEFGGSCATACHETLPYDRRPANSRDSEHGGDR